MNNKVRITRIGAIALTVIIGGSVVGIVVSRTTSTPAPAPEPSATVAKCVLPAFGPGASYRPQIDRSGFTPNVTNQYLPLRPGDAYVYTGVKDGHPALDVVQVSSSTKVIDGVTTRVVNDRLFIDNKLEETTSDYFSQDPCGNVWYFGEDTATLDPGQPPDTSGTFHAGVNGAQPGVFMQAKPEVGRWFRQEWASGDAQDQYRVLSVKGGIMRTEEITALEPGVIDNKLYARNTGNVVEKTVIGGNESLALVARFK